MWFSVVCTLIDNDICHHSGQNVVRLVSPQQISTTVMTNIIVGKSADNAKTTFALFFYHNINVKENFYNNCKDFRALIDVSSVV